MWTLLSAGAERPHNRVNGAELHVHRDAGTPDHDRVSGQSAAAHGPASSNGSLEVLIYMHPGRLPLGCVGFRQAHEQFDLSAARAFGTFEEAEPACASRTGFLLELRGDSAALAEHAPGGAVLFVESLRS